MNLAALVLALLPLASADDKVPLSWQGKRFTSAEWPKDLPEAGRKAALVWEGWAQKAGCRMDFEDKARVLLVTRRGSSRADKQMQVLGRVSKWFDALLPTPPRTAPGDDGVEPAEWGSGSAPPDSQTAVVIVLKDEKDHHAALAFLGTRFPELKEWADKAPARLGFVTEIPLCGGFVENAAGNDEWDPDHELVNRIGQLLVLRRFGQQPNWLVQGLAWEAETAYDKSIYCYPYRAEFVYAVEHTAWPLELRKEFQDRKEKPLTLEEFALWPRGRFDPIAGRYAWGFVHFLAAQKKAEMSLFLEDMRVFRDTNDRKEAEDGSWARIPGYRVPLEAQLAMLKKRFGDDVLDAASAAFRK